MRQYRGVLAGFAIMAVTAMALVFTMNLAQAQRPTEVDPPKPKDKAEPKKQLTVMERKLKYSQQVLTGLAMKDFDKIAESATELQAVLKEATWRINDTKEYLLHSNEFLRQTESLQKAAKKKNIDAATLAYVEMTFTCVKCHEHLRETRMGAAPRNSDKVLAVVDRE